MKKFLSIIFIVMLCSSCVVTKNVKTYQAKDSISMYSDYISGPRYFWHTNPDEGYRPALNPLNNSWYYLRLNKNTNTVDTIKAPLSN